MNRDTNIDMLRGAVMLYIVFAIHSLCWTHLIDVNSVAFSLMLMEMPVIFYISGASLTLSTPKSTLGFIKSRFTRVVLPYLVWSVITLAIAVFAFGGDCLEQAKLILLCQEGIIVPLASCHIWFVYPYLIISLLGYYLYKAYKKHSFKFVLTYTAVIALALIVLDKCLHLEYQLLRDVMVYSIFYVYGFTYKKSVPVRYEISALILLAIIYLTLIVLNIYPFSTQLNKFPPNFEYLCFGGIVVLALSLIVNRIQIPECKVLYFSNKYGYEMYLYQSYAIWLFSYLDSIYFCEYNFCLRYLLCLVIVSAVLFPVSFLMGEFDRKITNVIQKNRAAQ